MMTLTFVFSEINNKAHIVTYENLANRQNPRPYHAIQTLNKLFWEPPQQISTAKPTRPPSLSTGKMCQLTCHLAARCRHPICYQYDHCAQAPYPNRCPVLVNSVDASVLDDNKPFCDVCYKKMETEMTDQFRQERLRLTAKARAEDRSVVQISEMRKELMIEHYERLKCANKPLPAVPTADDIESPSSSTSNETWVGLDEDEAAEIRQQLKDWNYKKLDYLHKPFPVDRPRSSFHESEEAWLERDDSGVQLRYVNAPRYGQTRAHLGR